MYYTVDTVSITNSLLKQFEDLCHLLSPINNAIRSLLKQFKELCHLLSSINCLPFNCTQRTSKTMINF